MRVRSAIALTGVLLSSFALTAPPALAVVAHSGLVSDGPTGSGASLPPDFTTQAVEDPATHAITLSLKTVAEGATYWQMTFTPFSGQLAAATTYPLAATPSASATGASLESCPLSGGTLKVLDLVRSGGALTAAGADISLDCDGWGGITYYSFRWQSTSPDSRASNLWQDHNGFPSVDVGQTGASLPYVYGNAGPTPAHVSAVTIAGANPADFTVTQDTCSGATIAASGTCSIQVAFTPTGSYQRSAVLTVADDSLRGERTLPLSAFAYGPPGPATGTATTRSDGVQLRWQVGELGGRPLQYVELLRGETADTLQHLGQVASGAGTFADRLGSATAPLADHDYVYGVRAHTDHGDGALTTMSGHVPVVAAPLTTDAVATQDGAWGIPYAGGQSYVVDGAVGGSMGVSVAQGSGDVSVTGSGPGAYVDLRFPPEAWGGELATKSYTHPFSIQDGAVYCPSGTTSSYAFEVHEVAYDSGGQVSRLAADYRKSCGGSAPAVTGVVRWHSDLAYQAVTMATPAADFPVKVATTVPLVVTYRNAGTVPVTVSGVTLAPATPGGSTSAWAVGSTTCLAGALAPGSQCTATLNVTPATATRQEVLVHFADDSELTTHTRKVSAYGITVTTAPALTIQGVSSSGVALRWTQTYGAHGEPSSWQVYRKIGSSAYSFVKTVPRTTSASVATWTDPYLGYGVRSYIVKSINAAGGSPYSTVRSTTLGPLVPRSVVATGLTRRVMVTWSAPLPSWTPQPLSGYAINRVSSTGALVRLGTRSKGGPLAWPVTGLAPGQKVGIRIQALYGSLVGPASTAIVGTATASNLLFAGYDASANMPTDNDFRARGVTGGRIVDAAITQTNPSYGYVNLSSPPALSPNRQYMVLSGNPALAGWHYRLAVRRTDGAGGVRFLTPGTYSAWSPAVSHDGKWVAFSKILSSDGHVHLYRIPWGGGTPTLIPNSKDLDEPSWSADGKSVYATRVADSNLGVVKLTLGGTRKTIGSGKSESPVVSPDGKTVTYFTRGTSGSALKVLTTSTGSIRTLVSNTGGLATRASWTPSSGTIYYTVYGPSGTLLRRINRSGTGLTSLASLGKSAHYVVYEQW